MNTVEILTKLKNILQKKPASISSLPWNDLQLCMDSELEHRNDFYSPTQYQIVYSSLLQCFKELDLGIASQNTDSLLITLDKLILFLNVLPDMIYVDTLTQKANFDHACLEHYKNDTVIVLGDSHVNFFSGNEMLSYLPIGENINTCIKNSPHPFTPLHLGACLAYNCLKPNSTFHFVQKVQFLCEHFIKPHATILCCLGEIDLRVHVFRQTKLQNRPYQEIVDDILSNYIRFLISLKSLGYSVYCWGPIASQKDSSPIVDPNFPRTGTEVERNRATAYFNHRLASLCASHNIGFLSIFDSMITDQYETIENYLSPDYCHLSQRALPLAQKEWNKLDCFSIFPI